MVVPLDPAEGPRYTESVCDYEESDDDFDHIYKIKAWDQHGINPTTDGQIAWDQECSGISDSDEQLEHWYNRLYEVSVLRYNMMTKSLNCVSSEVRNLPYYDGLTNIDNILDVFEWEVPEDHLFETLDLALHTMPARWWGMQKDIFNERRDYRRMMRLQFGFPKIRMIGK